MKLFRVGLDKQATNKLGSFPMSSCRGTQNPFLGKGDGATFYDVPVVLDEFPRRNLAPPFNATGVCRPLLAVEMKTSFLMLCLAGA